MLRDWRAQVDAAHRCGSAPTGTPPDSPQVCSPSPLCVRAPPPPTRAACSTKWGSGTRWWTPRSRRWRPGACYAPRAPSRSRRPRQPHRPSTGRGPGTVPPSKSGSTSTPCTNGWPKVSAQSNLPLCGPCQTRSHCVLLFVRFV